MLRKLAAWLFRWSGWKLSGPVPRQLRKAIWIVAPHATAWDFVVGVGARATVGLPIRYLAKQELFRPPFGWFFRAMGGQPVDRSRDTNRVDAVVRLFGEQPYLHVALAPEGTRKNVDHLKTGFYYMALGAGVPIVLVGFDYPRRTVFLSTPFHPTGDWPRDRAAIARFYAEIQGMRKSWVEAYLFSEK